MSNVYFKDPTGYVRALTEDTPARRSDGVGNIFLLKDATERNFEVQVFDRGEWVTGMLIGPPVRYAYELVVLSGESEEFVRKTFNTAIERLFSVESFTLRLLLEDEKAP